MKKSLVIITAVLLMCSMLLSGCAKSSYDFAANDLSSYIELPADLLTRDYTAGLTLKGAPTSEDVDKKIEELLKDKAEEVELGDDAEVKDGDTVVMDYVGKINGEEFTGGSATDSKHAISIEKSTFIEGFDKGLIGMKKNETKDLNLKFPANYSNADVAGKDVVFTVTIDSITRKQIPEVTDDYVKNNPKIFGEEFTTAEAYRNHVLEDLKTEHETENKKAVINAAWQYVLENCSVKGYPEGLLEEYESTILEYYEHSVAASKEMHLKAYVKSEGHASVAAFKEAVVTPEAKDALKEQMALYAVAQKVGVSVTDAEAEESAKKFYEESIEPLLSFYSAYYGISDYKSFLKQYGLDYFKDGMVFDKAFEKVAKYESASTDTGSDDSEK